MPSLSAALYQQAAHLSGPVTVRPNAFQVGSTLVHTGPAHLMDINYANLPHTQVISAIDVINGTVDPNRLSGRIVLVGATAQGLQDFKLTPLDKSTGQPGVVVHANALNTMLSGHYLYAEGKATTTLNAGVFALVVALGVMFLWLWVSPLLTAGLIAAFVAIAFRRFDSFHVMNLVYPLLGAVVAYVAALAVKYFTEVRERRRVTHVFGRYVAPDVVEEVLAHPQNAVATLKGASRPLSILFADLRGFTAASENASPEDVVQALNVYLDAMTRAVLEEQGTIDKFMGDCVMAFWGAPRDEPQHALKAIRAAMRMQDYIDEAMGDGSAASKLRVKGCGVGVSTGVAVVGNIGSADRLDYTVIGDTVNTASRLCGVAGAGEIVCTADTAYMVGLVGPSLRLGELPPLVVKGKAEPLKVFQVLREGQEAIEVREGELTVAVEEKGHFEPAPQVAEGLEPAAVQQSPPKVAGYAPVEPGGFEGAPDDDEGPSPFPERGDVK
jgi:adenylate cyclase